jgi:hypothetical protein
MIVSEQYSYVLANHRVVVNQRSGYSLLPLHLLKLD